MAVKIIISGCNGRMGRVIEKLCTDDTEISVIAGFDVTPGEHPYPVFADPADCTEEADAVIDFSSPAALNGLLTFGMRCNVPLILATTGYTQQQLEQIQAVSLQIPIFRSANMSLGINVLLELVKKAASVLGDSYDIEIVEKHHNRKVDAPSGTALMIADAAAQALEFAPNYKFERHSTRQPREKNEIGISTVRGGTIVGIHEVIFAGTDEIIEIRHTAMSRDIFANGAIRAAKFFGTRRAPGMYDMTALVQDQQSEQS